MIASLSKSFTAAAVLQQVEAGRLSLDVPVRSYLPEFAVADSEASRKITVRHLLNHTSGLSDAGYPEMRLPQTTTIHDRVLALTSACPEAQPGERFHYFNANYAVLALLVERVSGLPFNTYLTERLFRPLGMTRTFAAVTMAEVRLRAPDLAEGHVELFGQALPWREGDGNLAGSGGVVSTAEDMARWMSMLLGLGQLDGERVLSPESVLTMQTSPPGMPYAMGWFVTFEGAEPILSHDGVLSTFFAEAMLFPKTGQGIIMLVNINSLPHALLTFARLRNALRAFIMTDGSGHPALSVREVGFGSAILTMFLVSLAVWRSSQFKDQRRSRAGWADSGWWAGLYLIPLAVLASLPWTIQWMSGRAFDFTSLALAMLDFVIPLGAASVLCCISAGVQIARRLTSRRQRER
jgi:CubicO group peptidase (beta-lactamase class C family)